MSDDKESARTKIANRAGCTRLGACPAPLHHEDCAHWMDQRRRREETP